MKLLKILFFALAYLTWPNIAFAAQNNDVSSFTNQTLSSLFVVATLASVFFLIRGGYLYLMSSGNPDSLEEAKKTIRNALIGLILVLGAGTVSSIFQNAFSNPSVSSTSSQINLTPIVPTTPQGGLTQVLIDAIAGFLQNIIQSATKPLVDGIISFLTTTPPLVSNSVIFNFWLVILGIANSLFALMVALLGFHVMSASTFGFDEIEFKHLLPRVGLAFLGANISIFLVDWIVLLCNTLVNAVLKATGGISSAWVLNAFDPSSLAAGTTSLITLIFMVLFVILAVVLLLFYISRLIIIALGAVLSPLIFLLWAIPKFADYAEISAKTYITSVFSIFVHVVLIQLASAFLAVPGQTGTNSLLSILVGIGLLFTLLKTPSIMMQLVMYSGGRQIIKKLGGQIMNVVASAGEATATATKAAASTKTAPRRRMA